MTTTSTSADTDQLAAMLRQFAVEQFYYREAALLDAHHYDQWVELFSDDTRYFVPIRRTRGKRELDKEFTQPGEMAFMDETKGLLHGRAIKFSSGRAWAEDPPSRTRHLITNVVVREDDGAEMVVESNFLVYRTRLKSDEDTWVGRRHDRLRRSEGGLLIAARTVYLEQTVILSRNLSNFF